MSELTGKVGAAAWLLTIGGMTRPDTGRIVVDGRDISTLSGPKRDALGGSIAKVQENMAELNPKDREAIDACLE